MKGNSLFQEPYLHGLRPKSFLGKTKSLMDKKVQQNSMGKSFNKDFGKKKLSL